MLKRTLVIVILIVVIFNSCGVFNKGESSRKTDTPIRDRDHLREMRDVYLSGKLESELNRWQTFKITGMTELQYQAFSIRGQVVISKESNKFRFDLLNQGIFGLGGVVLAMYADSEKLQTRMPGSSSIETHELNSRIGNAISFFSENFVEMIMHEIGIVIETNQVNLYGFDIYFTEEMRLSQINNPEQNIKIDFIYDRNDNPLEITITTQIIRPFTIHIDKIEHENISITPLR